MTLLTTRAIKNGHGVVGLKALRNRKKPASWSKETTNMAANMGDMDSLTYAVQNGCPVSIWAAEMAAENGHLDCLKFLASVMDVKQYNIFLAALKSKNRACIDYCMYDLRISCTPSVCLFMIKSLPEVFKLAIKDASIKKKLNGRVFAHALMKDDDELISMCLDYGTPIDQEMTNELICYQNDSLDIFVKLESKRAELMERILKCFNKHKISIIWNLMRGYPNWLQYFHKTHGWDLTQHVNNISLTTSPRFYAENGLVLTSENRTNIECIKYGASLGIALDKNMIDDAIVYHDIEAFEYALRNIPLEEMTFLHLHLLGNLTTFADSKKVLLFIYLIKNLSVFLVNTMEPFLDVMQSLHPVHEFSADEWDQLRRVSARAGQVGGEMGGEMGGAVEYVKWEESCAAYLLKRYTYPRVLRGLRNTLKVGPYAWHWYGEWQEALCAPSGAGRLRDLRAFQKDNQPKRQRTT